MKTQKKVCEQKEAFERIAAHVADCTHCARKWAGLRQDQPYCADYQELSRAHDSAPCSCPARLKIK